ncbi:hypothetical protein F5Y00DRAFT_41882 [Daldinia vernicosa]|uniref:uncharacterized protein n=1 Tax=Daldinia vernicosa TaxID=114800 RepID=UPI002007733D|nr:uncharacterized protein F5Y00DRAFT_41882 [Daldinia vernicosa]KAI0850140.1 hypothetical protein F5Y00DRAFT_41882 [Daldinia vernicosa]
MSYSRSRVSGFEDERRRPYGGTDSYKPFEDRHTSSEYSRDRGREVERDRDRNMVLGRRDSGDAEGTRSPHGRGRDMGGPKDLHRLSIDTRIPTGPRRTVSGTYSPASAMNSVPTRPTSTEPATDGISKTTRISSPGPIAPPSIPKAKDPRLQEVFEVIYKCNETSQERMLLKLRKSKLLREDHQRRRELDKIASKVNDYAPYSEFQRRFDECGKLERDEISTSLAKLDQQFAETLERAVSSITSSQSQATDNNSLRALEAKFAEFQKQSSEQQKQISDAHAQIQILRSEREQSVQAFNNLDKDFKVLRSDYNTLQSENSQLKTQIADLDALRKTQDDLNRLTQDLGSFTTRVDEVERKATAFMDKVKELDMETYNEILETWIDHDFKSKVFSNEKTIASLRQDFRSLQESATSHFDKNDSFIQETRKFIENAGNSRPVVSQLSNATSVNQPAQEGWVQEKLDTLRKVMQKTVADSGESCAEMVDELAVRVDKISADVKALEKLSAQINMLKQTGDGQHNALQHLQDCIKSLEAEGVGPKLDNVIIKLADMEGRVTYLQQSNATGGTVGLNSIMSAIKSDVEDGKKRFDSLELAIRTLDSQWANLNSKQMAVHILQHLDSYRQQTEGRIISVEAGVGELKNKLALIEDNLALLRDPKYLAAIIKASPPLGKRPASPGSAAEDPMKKRKLDTKSQQTQSNTTQAAKS